MNASTPILPPAKSPALVEEKPASVVCYRRCNELPGSAAEQLDLLDQQLAIQTELDRRGVDMARWITDRGCSGARINHPGITQLTEAVSAGDVTHVVIADVFRLTRSARQSYELTTFFQKHNVELISCQMSTLERRLRLLRAIQTERRAEEGL